MGEQQRNRHQIDSLRCSSNLQEVAAPLWPPLQPVPIQLATVKSTWPPQVRRLADGDAPRIRITYWFETSRWLEQDFRLSQLLANGTHKLKRERKIILKIHLEDVSFTASWWLLLPTKFSSAGLTMCTTMCRASTTIEAKSFCSAHDLTLNVNAPLYNRLETLWLCFIKETDSYLQRLAWDGS